MSDPIRAKKLQTQARRLRRRGEEMYKEADALIRAANRMDAFAEVIAADADADLSALAYRLAREEV